MQDTTNPVNGAPLVSVIVPTYQHAGFIEECLQGILMQETTFPVEILIGEDESTDGTREICQDMVAEHPGQIKLFLRSRKNVLHILGRPTGRINLLGLLSAAQGRYVAICEGDDYWTDPGKLEKQVAFMEANPNYSMCFHRAQLKRDDAFEPFGIPEGINLDNIRFTDLLSRSNFIPMASILFRRSAFNPLPKWFLSVPFADLAIHMHLAHQGKIKCIDEFMSVYRITGKGAWSGLQQQQQHESELHFLRIIRPYLAHEEIPAWTSKWITTLERVSMARHPGSALRRKWYKMKERYIRRVLPFLGG